MKITYITPLDWYTDFKKITPKGYDFEVVRLENPIASFYLKSSYWFRWYCNKNYTGVDNIHYIGDYADKPAKWRGIYTRHYSKHYSRSFVGKNKYVYWDGKSDSFGSCTKRKKGARPQWIYTPQHENLHMATAVLKKVKELHNWIALGKYDVYEKEYLIEDKATIKFHKATHKFLGTWRRTQNFGSNDLSVYANMNLKGHNGLDFYSPVGWKMYFNVETPNNITWSCYNYNDKFGKKIVYISDEKVQLKDGLFYVGVTHLHIKESRVSDGQKIKFGDYTAITGNTGLSTGPHTHESLKKTTKNGVAQGKRNGYNGAIDHTEYYS